MERLFVLTNSPRQAPDSVRPHGLCASNRDRQEADKMPEFSDQTKSSRSIVDGLLRMVDHNRVHRPLLPLQREPQLLPDRSENRGT